MYAFWDDEDFWNQVKIGYTDVDYTDNWSNWNHHSYDWGSDSWNKDWTNGWDWEMSDWWKGDSTDEEIKKWLKNKHQKNTGWEHFGEWDWDWDWSDWGGHHDKKDDLANEEYDGFIKGEGKCRLPDGTFGEGDSYWAGGPDDPNSKNRDIYSMKKCKKACKNDGNCMAFHWYLLDPSGYTNCWIWTSIEYVANGSEKAYCFVRELENDTDDDGRAVDTAPKSDKFEKENTEVVDLNQIHDDQN